MESRKERIIIILKVTNKIMKVWNLYQEDKNC